MRSTGDRDVYAQRTRFISNAMLSHFKKCSGRHPESRSRCFARHHFPHSPEIGDKGAELPRLVGLVLDPQQIRGWTVTNARVPSASR